MVEGIHLRNELTWNKPMPLEFHSEVRKTVQPADEHSPSSVDWVRWLRWCLRCSWAERRAAIRVMQGKPAATEPEFLRIDLSGRGCTIHPEGSGARLSRG